MVGRVRPAPRGGAPGGKGRRIRARRRAAGPGTDGARRGVELRRNGRPVHRRRPRERVAAHAAAWASLVDMLASEDLHEAQAAIRALRPVLGSDYHAAGQPPVLRDVEMGSPSQVL